MGFSNFLKFVADFVDLHGFRIGKTQKFWHSLRSKHLIARRSTGRRATMIAQPSNHLEETERQHIFFVSVS